MRREHGLLHETTWRFLAFGRILDSLRTNRQRFSSLPSFEILKALLFFLEQTKIFILSINLKNDLKNAHWLANIPLNPRSQPASSLSFIYDL